MRRRRRLWTLLLALPLVLLLAVTIYWRVAIGHLEDGFAAWVAQRRAAGWTEQHGPPSRGGWPIAATLTIPSMSLAGGQPDIPGGLTWNADRIVLRVALTRPDLLEIEAEGKQALRLADSPPVPYSAERFELLMPLPMAQWPRFADLDAENLRIDTPYGGPVSVRTARLRLDFNAAAQEGEPVMTYALRADSIAPPPGAARPFGPRISSLEAEGALNGPVPETGTPAERAAAWRDGGGSFELRRLALAWGPLDLTATATLALDEQLQPMGAGSTRMVGYAETLDALAANGAISKSAAIAAKAVLSLLASSPDDGRPPEVEVPLTLQYRTLSMRQVPLVRLPELDWP